MQAHTRQNASITERASFRETAPPSQSASVCACNGAVSTFPRPLITRAISNLARDPSARVVSSAKTSASRRLAIYYDAYRLRLLEALDSNYPILHSWMGDDEFEKLGLAYLDAHPSTHFSIRYFGHRLSEFPASAEASMR